MAESFGVDPERYDRTRPAYPDALVARVMAHVVAGGPGRDVLDVGSGTGIVARQFQAAGAAVLAVEPDARMAAFAHRHGVDIEVATFEAWDPRGRTFDAVVAGTAWHWVDPVAGAAKAAQVLRPGGLLAAFGHAFQLPRELMGSMTSAAAVIRQGQPAPPATAPPAPPTRSALELYEEFYATAADGIREAGGFAEPQVWRYPWERSYTRDEWLDQLPTTGVATQLSPDALAAVLESAGAAIDALGGSFTMPYTTVAVAAVRT